MSETYFTSDNHFFHKNILNFSRATRIGDNVNELNENMIRIWNDQVKPNDTVYCLGDFCFGGVEKSLTILPRLNGRLNLLRGNHDHWINAETTKYFEDIRDYRKIKMGGKDVMMFHYPIQEWDKMHRGSYHLYGHVHGNYTHPGKALDVGIDNRPKGDMKLWTWAEIEAYMKDRPVMSHHGKAVD